jgi:hypothetical protein
MLLANLPVVTFAYLIKRMLISARIYASHAEVTGIHICRNVTNVKVCPVVRGAFALNVHAFVVLHVYAYIHYREEEILEEANTEFEKPFLKNF